jgi:ElaB/YqjD/DUF883 family membrane-anchored ribosome-binding protein
MGEKSDPVTRMRRSVAPADEAALDSRAPSRDVSGGDLEDIALQEGEVAVASDSTDATPDQIREEIEQTRAQMSGTIDEIQERLRPARLVNEAKETVRDATVGKVKDMMNNASESAGGIVERIKENPVQAALIGIGAYWLFGRQNSGQSSQYRGQTGGAYGGRTGQYASGQRSGGFVDTLKQHPVPATLAGLGAAWWLMDRKRTDSSAGGSYGDGSGYATDYASYESGDWPEPRNSTLREMASDATETASEVAGRTKQAVADYAARAQETVGEYTDRAQTEFDRLLRDNPLALGVVAVAVGAAVGMAIPETHSERAIIGEAGHQLAEKAQNLAKDAVDKVQQVASDQAGNPQQP